MKTSRSKSIAIFVALTLAGICLVVFGQSAIDLSVRTVLPLVGAGMFSSGLTYFLVKQG